MLKWSLPTGRHHEKKPLTNYVAASAFNLELGTSNVELPLERFGNPSRADATGAHLDASHGAVIDGFDLLQVRMPGPAGFVVGVANVVAETGAFAAYLAYF
jgi:hypothetical protein